MCLGIPGKVVKIDGDVALVDIGGVKKQVDIFLVPDVKVGDYVIVHAGSAISKVNEKEAHEMLKAWEEIVKSILEVNSPEDDNAISR